MSLISKIKNILFEDDTEDIPVYQNEDKEQDSSKEVEIVTETRESREVTEPVEDISFGNSSHASNLKRDFDSYFDDEEIKEQEKNESVKENSIVKEEVKVEEKPSIFPSFDVDEFERANSRVNRNESKVRKEPVSNNSTLRRANNNFYATSTLQSSVEKNVSNSSNGKKPFTPSPVISPVYGILDYNYKKDEIVDKKDGLKREITKTVKRVELKSLKPEVEDTYIEVDIDTVRKKAYGELEDLEKSAMSSKQEYFEKEIKEEIPIMKEKAPEIVPVKEEIETKEEVIPEVVDNIVPEKIDIEEVQENNDVMIEDQIDYSEEEIALLDSKNVISIDEDEKEEKEISNYDKEISEEVSNNKILNDLEKTSTLQILDDIERELNSIKPISKDYSSVEEDSTEFDNDDTLENDLFNLIDSMYEEGEEEDDD